MYKFILFSLCCVGLWLAASAGNPYTQNIKECNNPAGLVRTDDVLDNHNYCNCAGTPCEIGKFCDKDPYKTLSGGGQCLDSQQDGFNPCPMIPVPGVNATDTWPYIHGKSPEYKWERNESTSMCICNERWACKEGYEMCSEFLGCIPRFDVTVDSSSNQYVRSETEGYKGWIIWENPDAIIEQTIKDNFNLYGKTTDNYLNQVWRYFDMESESCDAVGIADSFSIGGDAVSIPKSWTSTDTPRNPDRLKQGFTRSTVVHSKTKSTAAHHMLPGQKEVKAAIHKRSISLLAKSQAKEYPNPLYRDFIEMKWQCTDFDYAENIAVHGHGSLSSSTEIAFTTKGTTGYKTVSHLTRAKQKVNLNNNGEFDKFPFQTHRLWSKKETESGKYGYDDYKDSVEKSATVGSVHKMWIMPFFDDVEHHKSNISGTADTIGLNGLRAIFSNDYKSFRFKSVPVRGCTGKPQNLDAAGKEQVRGEAMQEKGTCYDMYLAFGNPQKYGNEKNKYFTDVSHPFWVLTFGTTEYENLVDIPSSKVLVSNNLKAVYAHAKVLGAASCRIGTSTSSKVLTNDAWAKLVSRYTADYKIKEVCDTIFSKFVKKQCMGGCLKSSDQESDDDRDFSNTGYWRQFMDFVKLSGKCVGRHSDWKDSRLGPQGVDEKGSKTNKIDSGPSNSGTTWQGYADIWTYKSNSDMVIRSDNYVGSSLSSAVSALSEYGSSQNWAFQKLKHSKVYGYPHLQSWSGLSVSLSDSRLRSAYSQCPTARKYEAKAYGWWDDYEYKVENKCNGRGAWDNGWFVKNHPPTKWWWYDRDKSTGRWSTYEGKGPFKYETKQVDMRGGTKTTYVFGPSTRYQFTYGAKIHIKYEWQTYRTYDDLNSGTIVPTPTNPYVHYVRMNEDVPAQSSEYCHYQVPNNVWLASDKDAVFVEKKSLGLNNPQNYWKLSKQKSKARQLVIRGDSFEFCRNDEEATGKCLCGRRSCDAGEWCYYRHFTSDTWKGDSFDLIGWCASRKLIPCESVDPSVPFTSSTKDIKPRDDDCICGTEAINPAVPISIENIKPRWVYISNGPYMTCNFDLNVYGQGDTALEVPILGPPCSRIYGVRPNERRCTCYTTKKNKLTADDAMEHIYWSDFFEGQYCFQDEKRVEHVAFALVKEGFCDTYDKYSGHDTGPWSLVLNPNQCLEGSNRIDDKTLTINPKVRFTRSKHDQAGCSWDKGGWFLLFNDYRDSEIACDDTYAEDPTRSGCICQLRGERCSAVHAEQALSLPAPFLNEHNRMQGGICLCGQKKCSDGKFCYEKLSGCEDTNSFECNYSEEDNMCWPDGAQRIVTKVGVRRNVVYLVEPVPTTPQQTPVCPEGADGQKVNDFGPGHAAPQQCICGDAFKVLPTICDPGDYCHHRLNICYKEKQNLCPTNVFLTDADQCLCGLKKSKPSHLMNVYSELEEATEEPHDQAKFFKTIYCERSQLCVLRDYADSLDPDAMCLSGPVEACPDYPTPNPHAVCRCSPKALAKEGQYCFKGEVRDELHPYCQDMHTDPSLTKYTLTNCYCPTSGNSRGTMVTEGDNTFCDFRTNSFINNCGHDGSLKCATRRTMPTQICDDGVLLTSTNTPNRCKCNGKLQSIVCIAGEMCGMLEGGLPKCYSSYIETCDPTLSCVESLARADTCFCDGIQTETDSICTGAGIVKNPTCDRYESPYDVVKKEVYFHNFNQLQFGVQQQTFVIEDVVYGEEYDPLAYPGDVTNVKTLKKDAPDWCDPLLAFDNPDHYDCLYLPTKADIESEVSVRIEWSTENEYLIPGASTVELKTTVDNVNNEISNCKSYRVTVHSNDYTTGWEDSDAHSTILDSLECPNGFCIARKDSGDSCVGSNDCIQPEYEQCDLFGTSKRYFTWLRHSEVYEQSVDIDATGYASAYNSAFVVQDTEYIESGMYTKNDLLKYSTEILMCTLEDIATKSANTVEFITEGTTAPHAFVFAFDGECTGTELRMYEGNGDNAGSANERRNKCAKACAEKKPSLSSTSWADIDGQDITGFIVIPTSGRCYCEVPASQDCTKILSSTYDRYDFIEPFYSWTQVDIEDRRSSIVVPVVEDGEQLLTCVVGLFSADIMQRKDPTPLEVTTVERRFMGGNPSMTHFSPAAIAVDVKAVSGAHVGACTALNNEENTGWMSIHHAFHRNPCNTILDRSNTYQLQNSVKNVERVEEQSVEYAESEQTCVFERIYETTAQIKNHVANGKCKYTRPLPEGWWAPRLHKSDPLAHSDPAEECARRCYSAYKSRAFTLKTSHGIPTWLDTHTGFESSAFRQNYAGSNFWDKFNSLQQQWESIPKATRHDECACAYDTCEEVTDELNILPIHKINDVDPCFETFFPIFFSLHDDPIQQKLYFEKSFVRENVCDVGNPTDRFSKTYYSSYTIEAVPLSVMSPQVTNIKAHFLDDKGHLATDNGGIVLQDIDFSKGWSAHNYYNNNIPKCAGDCDRDSHCASGLKCFQRSYGENVPGCKPGGNRWLDLCYDPSDIGKPEFEAVEINGFSQVEQGTSTYLAQICVKYVPWCPVITENTRIEDINENMFECMCSTQANKKTWEPNNPFWVYERQKIYKNEAKYCLQEPDTRKVMIDKMPCSAFNKTIDWSLAFDKSSLGIFPVENLQECYCGGDNGLYCSDTEFCMGDQNERVCQSLNQLIDKDLPVRVIEQGTCADIPGWEPVQDPLFCYAQRQLLLRPHGYEITTSDAQEQYNNYPDLSLLDDVKYARLGDVQDKHETDELYYGLTFQTGCSLSYISQVDDNVPFYKNEHLAPIKDPSTGEDVPITHRKYTGSWGERCAIPGLAEWYYETAPNRYSTAYYSCDQPAEVSIWEEFTVRQNAFGTTRALPKLHSGDVNRVLGLYAKLGDDDFAAGEQTLQVNTKNVEYMQFSQIEDIPAEVYNIKYKQKKLCKLDRPLCSDIVAGNAYDSKFCINSDGSVVDAGALQIPTGKTVALLVQSGTCAQSAANSIETAEQCGAKATELGYSAYALIQTGTCASNGYSNIEDVAQCKDAIVNVLQLGFNGVEPYVINDNVHHPTGCVYHPTYDYIRVNSRVNTVSCGTGGVHCVCLSVDVITETSGPEPFTQVSDDTRGTALDYHKIFENGYPVSTLTGGTDKDSPDQCAAHCVDLHQYEIFTSGSCESRGYEQIANKAECDAATSALDRVSGFNQDYGTVRPRCFTYDDMPGKVHYNSGAGVSSIGEFNNPGGIVCMKKPQGFVFRKDGKCHCSAVKASTSSKTSDDRYTAYDFEEYGNFEEYGTGYFLISSGTCASHNGVQVTEQADCQAARDELGLTNFYPGSYTPGTVPNCFVYTHLPNRVYYNTNTGSTDTPVPSSTYTAQVMCKKQTKKIPQRFVYKGGGICNSALGIRVYNGASDNPGTDSKSNQIECAKACLEKKTPLAYGPWSSRGDALGFSVDANGRCYCNHKTWSGCSGSIAYANLGYSFYDFADRQVYTNPSSCPEGFYYQNGICTRLVSKTGSHYCHGGAWGQYVHETNYNTINYLMDPTECATRCSEYAASNQLGNVQKGQILRHYASNRVKGNSKNCFCHTIGYAPDGHCEDKNNLVSNSYYNTLVIDTVIPDTGDYSGTSNQLARSRCAQKCSRVDGFSITNDGNCLCEEEGSSTSAYVDSNSFTRYKTNEALKYFDNHLHYIKIGDGYCSDWKYLPEGGYPDFLGKSSPLFSRDRIRECMNRCLDAYPGSEAFYIKKDNNKCACSSGQCQSQRPSTYTSYKITKCVGEGSLPDYSLKYSGSCERHVTSVEECEIAAVQLGLSDTNIDSGSDQNINHGGLPYGCTQNPVKGDLYLNLNQATKTCGTSSYPCICRDEPVACPPGTFVYHSGSHCCHVNSDKNGNPIHYHSQHCLDNNAIACPAGAFDGACVDEKQFCPIANENADYILDKEHLAEPGADTYEVELVKDNAVCADSKYQSVVAIEERALAILSASQSNPYYTNGQWAASWAIDGDTSTFSHTKDAADNWLQLDIVLGVRSLSGVEISNRDQNAVLGARLGEFRIEWQKQGQTSWTSCGTYTYTDPGTKLFACDVTSSSDITAVRIIKTQSGFLHLKEVRVFGGVMTTADKCMDACVHGQEAACNREPDCVNGQICQSVSGHVIDNVGATLNDNAHPMRLDANSLVFGATTSGTWFKMVRTNMQGVMQETRHIEYSTVSSIESLTVALWNSVASRSNTDVAGRTTCVSARYCVKNVKFDCVGETKRWSNFLVSQHSSQFLGDGYCLPDTSGTRKFVTDFKSCEGRCASEPNCNVFAWNNANDDSRVSASQCIINLDSTCETSADGSNDYPWKRYKINRKPSGKYYEISEGLCSDTGGENIETEAECTEAAHYVKDAYCTKNEFENINGDGCRFSGYSYDRNDRPTGCFWYSDSQNELAWFNTNINLVEAGNGRKSICKKRVHGFLLKADGRCVCTTGMADASNCVNDNAFSSYKIKANAADYIPHGCSKSGSQLTFNPFASPSACDATNNCICDRHEYTVTCPANEFPLDETKSLEFCRCNGEELCSSDFAPYCLTNGKCVKNGKCIHDEALLAKCEGKGGWLRHTLDERENDICEEWFEQDTEKTRPRGGVNACGMVTCPRGHKYHEGLNACSNLNSNDFTMTAKLTEKTCADVTSAITRGHYDCEKYNIGKNTEYIAFKNARSVDLPYGCSSISYMKDNVLRYTKSTFNQYDSRQVCSQKTPCFCAVENMPACPINSVIDQSCLCGSENEIILEGGMCKNNKAYSTCFDKQQDVQLNWPCVCGQHLVVSKTYCSITEFESNIMQFSKYGADFEPLADTCHFQYSDIFVHVPRLSNRDAEILDLPNPHDSISSVLRTSGTRSIEKLTLENIMQDLNDLAASIKYANGSYTLGTENHTFAGIYKDEGLFCKVKACYYGISGNYTATTIIEGFECKSQDYTVTNEVIESVIDCASVCGHTKDCRVFSYNPNTNACKLEKTNTGECLEGWKPASFNTYKVGYNLEEKPYEDRICSDTLQFDKECKSTIQIQTESGKTIQLGSDQLTFSSPKELNFKGLFHTQEADKVNYYIGEKGEKNCYEDPMILCGVSKHI